MPEEAAKLDAKSTKRRNRRIVVTEKKAIVEYAVEYSMRRLLQHQADLDDKESIISKAHTLLTPANLSHPAMAAANTGSSAHCPLHHRSPSASVTQETSDAFQSWEAFKARHKDKPFTFTHCWVLIKDCPKFKDQYNALKKKRGQKAAVVNDGDVLKRPRGTTNSKDDKKRDAYFIAFQGTLGTIMSQKKMQEERKSKEKKEQMKIYLDLQTKKLDMEEAVKGRNLDIEKAAQRKKLEIEATIAETKAKEMALALMCVEKNNMSPRGRLGS
ncbi:ABC transporter C family member 3 [Hordeum vulgare]|nr:ABC transporter C family member 3 [Hordeum vulgare]